MQWRPESFPGCEAAVAWCWPLTSRQHREQEWVELYILSSICLHDVDRDIFFTLPTICVSPNIKAHNVFHTENFFPLNYSLWRQENMNSIEKILSFRRSAGLLVSNQVASRWTSHRGRSGCKGTYHRLSFNTLWMNLLTEKKERMPWLRVRYSKNSKQTFRRNLLPPFSNL